MVWMDVSRRRRRRPRIATGAAAPASGIAVLGIEVTQAVQNLAHDVRLIAGKATVVRAYVEPRGLASNARITGEIVVSAASGAPGSYVSSVNEVLLRAQSHPDLAAQRRDATLSLNFPLPDPPIGPMSIRFKRAIPVTGGEDLPLVLDGHHLSVALEAGPLLRVRALGLRYTDPRSSPPREFAPAATHFDHLRSFLTRVYPVSAIDWTQAVVAAAPDFVPPFSGPTLPNGFDPLWWALLGIAHQQMMMLRQADMDAGWDPRTHYYGLISDGAEFFRGAANDVPTTPAPSVVAVGPCGVPAPGSWDNDGSYGDWYGAHELAHTFGRFHPGFCRDQSSNDAAFPYPQGSISDAAQDFVGFDVGDPSLSLPMRAYPHEQWTDVMTYCDRQWISKYTRDGIYDRLLAEDALFAPLVG